MQNKTDMGTKKNLFVSGSCHLDNDMSKLALNVKFVIFILTVEKCNLEQI